MCIRDRVRTAEIAYAARNSDFGGVAIHQGDYLALLEHQLFGTDQDLDALLSKLAQSEDLQLSLIHISNLLSGLGCAAQSDTLMIKKQSGEDKILSALLCMWENCNLY